MSDRPSPPLDPRAAADRNLELAGVLLLAQLGDPGLLERVPAGATLVLIPDDDRALAEHNLALARRVFATGRNVYLYHVRAATPAAP
jgi:uncharacterized protein DUF5647